jgi:3',5'-cyclic AMP phosphodiesterase CpdA
VTVLLHMSDTHFGTEQLPVLAALQAFCADRRPEVLVYSGDVTQRARREEFAAARRFCDSLAIPRMLALPGNHDIPLFNLAARAFAPYAGYLEQFGPTLEPILELPEVLVIGVNTTRPSRHKNGEVSATQVARVAARLKTVRAGQLKVVVVHQPAVVLRAEDEHDRLRGADAALQAWSAAGADLVLGGHIHLPYVADLQAMQPPTPRPMWCVQAGTAVSSRVRHGTCNSVNLVHWRAPSPGAVRTCRVDRYDYKPEEQRFVQAESRVLALG